MQRLAPSQASTLRTPFSHAADSAGHGILAVTLALLLGAAGAQGQTRRCDLVGRDTTVTGVPTPFKRCLDLAALNGQTITVPSNVTRIDNDGLSLCKSAVQTGGDADIVYVYDNSGSMRGYTNSATDKLLRRAWIAPGGTDTLFYYDEGNCTDKTTNGTLVFTPWNTAGTSTVQDTITRLNSNAGCSNFSGDPYNVRGRAYRLGLQNQANRAPTSTAGIMFFNGSPGNMQSPLTMTPANLTTLQNRIFANASGGTNYTMPLDTSRTWLRSSAYTSQAAGRTKAMIFLSDGRPDNTTYLPLNPETPTIYGIFLHRDTIGSGRMRELSTLTGGKFYLIPPSEPDSLISVVNQILNIILLEYQPNAATVTNTSLSPTQSANSVPSDFLLQSDGSWLMRLNDIIGLRASNTNVMTVATTFKEKTTGALDNKTISFTIATTAPASTTSQKITNTQFAVTCYDPSALRILNSTGTRPAFFTDANSAYQIRVRTASTILDSVKTPAITKTKGDAENPVTKSPTRTPDSLVFKGTYSLQVNGTPAATGGNGTLETALYDSIVVSWVHPRDAQDVAADTMAVRAAKQPAIAYFSATEGGPAITNYPKTTTVVYVVIKDQIRDKRKTYTAVITAENLLLDREVVALTELPDGSGTFVGQLTIKSAVKTPGDNFLEIQSTGDQLRVVYKDPVDGDSAQGTAGFDQIVEEAADLQFTDGSGNPLPADAFWSPANGKLFVKYSDDRVDGTIGSKSISLTLANKKYGAVIGTDHERITVNLLGSSAGTRATWTGTINLADVFPPNDSNGTAETRFRGEATITVNSHNNKGILEPGTVSDFLVIAYPDSQAGIQWKMADTATVPKGTEGLIVTVKDQDFTVATNDQVFVTVTCLKSGDSVSNFTATEGSPQTYLSGTLVKDESVPNAADRILSCLTTDQIRITYVDPVYGTLTELVVNEVAKPEANPPGRKFITNEMVTLTTATPGAVIYYTLDGSTPVAGVSAVYTDPLRISLTTTVKAIASKPDWKDSKIMSQTYTKEAVASRLEILDENGILITGGVITGSAKNLRIRLITTQDNLPGVSTDTRTLMQKDAETVNLGNFGFQGASFEYWETVALKHPSAKASGNDTINATGTDTLIVSWANPFNPLDVAVDTLIIKPAFVAADVYFSLTEGGSRITQYPVNQDSIFVVVVTRPKDSTLVYTVLVSSSELGIDKETLTLVQLSPGVFSAKAPVGTAGKTQGDNIIQVSVAGDQVTAIFVDPVYKDSYQGDVGFARQVEERATLEFIDASGNLVAPADVWSPANAKVFLRYTDDWNAGIDGLVHTKNARMALVNRKSEVQVGTDTEILVLTLKGVPPGTKGTWEGELPLVDKNSATASNGTLEAYYRGQLTATVTPHSNLGTGSGADVVDSLLIAYPNQPAEIVIQDTSGKGVTRETPKVQIIIRDQLFTKSGDATINAMVGCIQSGDRVAQVTLVWDGSKYVITPPLDKGEINSGSVDKSDALLLCRDSDILTVTYTDPVYLDVRTADVRWSDDTKSRMYYASSKDSTEITSVSDATDKDFLVMVEGKSPNRDQVDTIKVTLTTAQGEQETVLAIETGILTGKFVVKADFLFRSADPAKENKKVEGKITVANRVNQVLLNGEAVIGGEKVKADLSLFSSYDLISKAYIKDEDENGRADHVYLVFDHKLVRLPSGLDSTYWNKVGGDFSRLAPGSKLSFQPGSDSTVVVADFATNQFGANLTNIPDGQTPYALLPDDNIFGGQRARLADSIGAVVVTANKLPSNLQSYNYSGTEKRFNPDTLIISISERIKTTSSSYDGLMRFSKGCSDYKESVPLKTFSEPSVTSDGLTWTVIVDNTPDSQVPLVGDCIFMEVDGRYVDLLGNRPGRLGVPLTGENPKLVIRGFRGFPPVAGMDPSTPGFVVVTNDKRTEDGGVFSNPVGTNGNWDVLWIPPYGFEEKNPVNSLQIIANNFTNSSGQDRHPEIATPKGMPRDISAVQVITSGAYKAQIHIYDNLGHFVRYMEQAYGMNGEDKNPYRATDKGQLSFLVWDLKDKNGQMAGQGVYVWKVNFMFVEKNKKTEVRFTKTGVMRNN